MAITNTNALRSIAKSKSSPLTAAVTPSSEESVGAGARMPSVSTKMSHELPLSPRDAMKKRELIELAVERSGLKKRDVKPAIEAALAILGETLAEGRDINMRPMGKFKMARMKKTMNGQVLNVRIRQPEEVEIYGPQPLAQVAEDR